MNESYMIIDGQWGSTGKGLIAGYLAMVNKPDGVVCNFGPNAGHTCVLDNGDVIMTQILPTAIISPSVERVFIGPGAVIDLDILNNEIKKYRDFLENKTLIVHPSAVVVKARHKETETCSLNCISSTCKGTGAAIADKVMRTPGILAKDHEWLGDFHVAPSPEAYVDLMNEVDVLQIESAQGMELGPNSGGFYPYCTSRDINPFQILSDCGIPWSAMNPVPEVIVSMRTYPIRVGHAFKEGVQIGSSGPVYHDQAETSWEKLGVKSETTTVTGKTRRVFTWSESNFRKMIKIIAPDYMFLNFCNYYEKNPEFGHGVTGARVKELEKFYLTVEQYGTTPFIRWIGCGPKISDVKERPDYTIL
jgi:adenylosuccinate synthase